MALKSIHMLAASIAAVSSTGTGAQEFYAMDMTGMGIYSQQAAMMQAAHQSDQIVQEPTTSAPVDPDALDYQSSSARRKANLSGFLAKAKRVDPQGAAAMETLFKTMDIIGVIADRMQTVGLDAGNVADAYTLWWTTSWYAARGLEAQLDRQTALAVRQQAAQAMMSSPEFIKLGVADKQQFAEALLVQAALVDSANETYRLNPKMVAKLSAAVNQGAQKMGLDLTTMNLTEDGFIGREGANAADAPGGREAVAAIDASDRDLSGYALPALGGAAALAAVFFLGRSTGRRG